LPDLFVLGVDFLSKTPLKKIESIQFGLLAPDEIRKMSAARIITADL
jgi:DNA-directed RNA polymerase beta' subunit